MPGCNKKDIGIDMKRQSRKAGVFSNREALVPITGAILNMWELVELGTSLKGTPYTHIIITLA